MKAYVYTKKTGPIFQRLKVRIGNRTYHCGQSVPNFDGHFLHAIHSNGNIELMSNEGQKFYTTLPVKKNKKEGN